LYASKLTCYKVGGVFGCGGTIYGFEVSRTC
jgi:hypothetical protein